MSRGLIIPWSQVRILAGLFSLSAAPSRIVPRNVCRSGRLGSPASAVCPTCLSHPSHPLASLHTPCAAQGRCTLFRAVLANIRYRRLLAAAGNWAISATGKAGDRRGSAAADRQRSGGRGLG